MDECFLSPGRVARKLTFPSPFSWSMLLSVIAPVVVIVVLVYVVGMVLATAAVVVDVVVSDENVSVSLLLLNVGFVSVSFA